MYPRSGKQIFPGGGLPPGPIQGSWSNKYRTFWASGGNIYELFQDGTHNLIGQVAIAGNPVTFRANGNQLLICSAGNVYIATGTAFFRPIISYNTGIVNIAGAVVAWVSDPTSQGFAEVNPGDLFMISSTGQVIAVQSVNVAANTLVLASAPGNANNIAFQLGTQYLTGVMCEYVDGYFIVNQPNTKTFWISQIEDGTTWNALDFGTKIGSVDNIASLIAFSGYLGLIGDTNSAELWGDSGSATFPFARVEGMSLNVGTAAAWSVQRFTDGSVMWLIESGGGEFQFMLSRGGAPQRVSNHALEDALASYPLVYDAITSTYIEGGHEYYRVDFPTANRTWEFDKTESLWTEQGVLTQQAETFGCDAGRYRVHVTWPNGTPMDLVGDFASGNIYQVSPNFTTDNGAQIDLLRIVPHINSNLEWMDSPEFALDCELGTVDPTLKGADGKPLIPMVQMAYSDDGARTWTDDTPASLGRSGEYEGTILRTDESFDTTPSSQTNPQMFEPRPYWAGLGGFWISRTYKILSTAAALRAVYNGLATLSK